MRADYGVLAELRCAPRVVRVDGWAPPWLGGLPLDTMIAGEPCRRLSCWSTSAADGSPTVMTDVIDPGIRGDHEVAHLLVVPLTCSEDASRFIAVLRPGENRFTGHEKNIALRAQPLLTSLDNNLRRRAVPRDPTPAHPDVVLTPRESDVLMLLAMGTTAKASARRLGISTHTVNRHLERIYRKLNTSDRLAAVLRAQSIGLLPGILGNYDRGEDDNSERNRRAELPSDPGPCMQSNR